jgi:5S rRNA maturation endonuclease (ribonuclease M5)
MTWRRCTRSRMCQVCGKPDWCSYTADGAHRCMRSSVAQGFRVVKVCEDGGTIFRLDGDRIPSPRPRYEPKPVEPKPDLSAVWARCFAACTRDMADSLAKELGLRDGLTLSLMGLGWHPELESWVFPMYCENLDKVVGLRTRDAEGNKRAVRGSSQGLFGFPGVLDYRNKSEPLLVCEGPTDTAAALEMGFNAIGRPSCSGAAHMIRTLANERSIVIVSDADEPGRRGADDLAAKLRRIASSVKIVKPPAKDIREWYAGGAGKSAMEFLISNARPCHA